MEQFYTDERNVQILISLLKEHGIRKVIASPGSTNVTFVGSLQQDPFFEIYSCVDERSAAYMACGLAAETQEVVVLSCTGATASRNYFPALTEAFYRKIPLLVVTSTQEISKVGNLVTQVIDRTQQPVDTVKMSVCLQNVKDAEDEWNVILKANNAILELNHHGCGPVHINLTTRYSKNFMTKELPNVRKINRISLGSDFPSILSHKKIAIFVGTHLRWNGVLTQLLDGFCGIYNSVVFCDPASNYQGRYRLDYSLVACQKINDSNRSPDLLIHIGTMSDFCGIVGQPKEVWRVSEDGELADTYHSLTNVFEMTEQCFFEHYVDLAKVNNECSSYYNDCISIQNRLLTKIPELPFSHIWIASKLAKNIPSNSTIHLGILSPLRSWGYFPKDASVEVYCNQGGFGIDGNISTLIGASLADRKRLYFGIVGDLSFFYDMNILGNRHVFNNIRILMINNSLGAEFHLFKQRNLTFVNDVQKYLSAGGHFGQQSPTLVKHYAEDLGFEYLCASDKDEFDNVYPRFLTPEITDKPMIFEVFTKVDDENDALYKLWNTEIDTKNKIKQGIKQLLPNSIVNVVKSINK